MTTLTGPEIMREWDYRYAERLGCLVGATEPTPSQKRIARAEADEWVRRYRRKMELGEALEMEQS